MIKVPTKLLSATAQTPTYGSDGSAGMDLSADFGNQDYDAYGLTPGNRYLVKTGVSMAIPPFHYGRIAPRSGLAYIYGIDVMAGVIDSDYRGEIGVILINLGDKTFTIRQDERIAQIIFENISHAEVVLYGDLPDTSRGSGGFGSTGV